MPDYNGKRFTPFWHEDQLAKNPKIKSRKTHGLDATKYNLAQMFYLPSWKPDGSPGYFRDFANLPYRGPLRVDLWISNAIHDVAPNETIYAETEVHDPRSEKLRALQAAISASPKLSSVNRRKVDDAVTAWGQTVASKGNEGFFRFGAALQNAGMELDEIRSMLVQHHGDGGSKSGERKVQIKSIMAIQHPNARPPDYILKCEPFIGGIDDRSDLSALVKDTFGAGDRSIDKKRPIILMYSVVFKQCNVCFGKYDQNVLNAQVDDDLILETNIGLSIMSKFLSILFLFISLGVSGCSSVPLPQDYARLNTALIVAQFRCEMRNVLKDRIIYALNQYEEDPHLITDFAGGHISLQQMVTKVRSKDLRANFERYAGATILYDFSLTMVEDNNGMAGAGVTRPFTNGSNTLGISLTSDHKRQNIRTFTIDDAFEKVVQYVDDEYCKDFVYDPNFNYPIAGRTNLADLVLTFLNLNTAGNLGTKPGGPKSPTISDQLEFTTKYTGSVSPNHILTPVGNFLRFTSAGGKLESSREDTHRVTIVLSMPLPGSKPTPLTISESRTAAYLALDNSRQNKNQVTLDRIANKLPSIF